MGATKKSMRRCAEILVIPIEILVKNRFLISCKYIHPRVTYALSCVIQRKLLTSKKTECIYANMITSKICLVTDWDLDNRNRKLKVDSRLA